MIQEMLRASDVASALSLTTGRVYQLLRSGYLPCVRIGGRILIPRAAWNQFLSDQSDIALASLKEQTHAKAA